MIPVGTRVRVVDDARPYIRDRVGTVSTCPIPDLYPPRPGEVVVDLDTEWGGVDTDWHLDEAAVEVIA